jgi:serine/threonine protein kinase
MTLKRSPTLEHPGIIAVYDLGESEGLVYIALSYIDGETVSEKVAKRLLPIDEAVRIIRDAASALGHAHERGVIHRDVTGRNIMVAGDGRVFVLDFGLALAAGQSRVTTEDTALGTIYYMAPEVIHAQQADARTDLYGLGIVLYEALTGTFPFVADAPPAVFYLATNEQAVPPRVRRPEIPEALERVVLKAIARDPAGRYQSAADFIAGIDELSPRSIDHPATPAETNPSSVGLDRPPRGPCYIAVLPFEATDSPPDSISTSFAGRLGEVLSGALAGADGVRVVDSTELGRSPDPEDVATRLGRTCCCADTSGVKDPVCA